MERRTPPASIRILAFDDNDELDVIGPWEMLDTARRLLEAQKLPAPDLRIVSIAGTTAKKDVVRGFHGLTFGTQRWTDGDEPDLLIVPGGAYKQQRKGSPPIGILEQMHNRRFTDVIAAQHEAGRVVASVCTGAFGLAGAGIVKGRRMTTHPNTLGDLVAFGAHVLNPDWDARVVDDGDIISCGGVTAGIDLALYLIQAFWPEHPALVTTVRDYVDFHYQAAVKT